MKVDRKAIQRWRRRGFYSEKALVKNLEARRYYAVRVPVSNPSRNPLPDVIARKENHVYAFEVKNARYYAYFPKDQIAKLFEFLEKFFPIPRENKHAVLAAHLGKKWIFKELSWKMWDEAAIPEHERIVKREEGNFQP